MSTQPAALKHPRPDSGLPGWAAAWVVLDRIDSDTQRDILGTLVRRLGVHGAPAMEFAATTAVRLAGLGLYRPPRKALDQSTVAFIEQRVADELRRVDAKRFPLMDKRLRG